MSSTRQPGPRERLLDTAQRLFYANGTAVGVDALLKEASVARRSLYEHFGDKDGLVAAVLRRAADEDLAWYENALSTARQPQQRLVALFDRLDELVANTTFRGCRYLAADLAHAGADHVAHAETADFRTRLRAVLVRELIALGHENPEHAAAQLHLLIEGTLAMGATRGADRPALLARDLAVAVIGVSPAPGRGRRRPHGGAERP